MEGDGDLNQALEKLLVFQRSGAPDIFESFVSVEEPGFIKQANSVLVLVKLHASSLHAASDRADASQRLNGAQNLAPKREIEIMIDNPTFQTRRSDSSWP